MPRNMFKLIVLVGVTSFLASCAWLDPIPRYSDNLDPSYSPSADPTLAEAVEYARRTRKDFGDRIGDQVKIRNSIATAQLLLMSGVAIDGLIDASEDAIIGASVLTATGFAAANFFDSPTRAEVLGLGIVGINCTLLAITPLQGIDTIKLSYALDEQLKSLPEVMAAAAKIAGARGLADSEVELRKLYVNRAEAVIGRAKSSHKNGVVVAQAYESAGNRLQAAVDRILGDVINTSLRAGNKLSALKAIITNLVFDASKLQNIPGLAAFDGLPTQLGDDGILSDSRSSDKNGPNKSGEKIVEVDFPEALSALGEAIGTLESATLHVDSVVDATDHQRPFEGLKQCGLDIKEAIPGVTVSPAEGIVFNVNTAAKGGLLAQGGTGQFHGRILGAPEFLQLSQPDLFSPMFDINYTGGGTAAQYRIVISDTTGSKVIVPIVLNSPTGNESSESGKGDQETKGDPEVEGLQTILTQMQFDTKGTDGFCGPDTDTALANFLNTAGVRSVFGIKDDPKCSDADDIGEAMIGALNGTDLVLKDLNEKTLKVFIFEMLFNQDAGNGEKAKVDGVLNNEDPSEIRALTTEQVDAEIKELLSKP